MKMEWTRRWNVLVLGGTLVLGSLVSPGVEGSEGEFKVKLTKISKAPKVSKSSPKPTSKRAPSKLALAIKEKKQAKKVNVADDKEAPRKVADDKEAPRKVASKKSRKPSSVAPIPLTSPVKSMIASAACNPVAGPMGWHMPVDDEAAACTLSSPKKSSDPREGLGFVVDRRNFKVFAMTDGEVTAIVGELMGCKVHIKPDSCPDGTSGESCRVTYLIPGLQRTADNGCVVPGLSEGKRVKACQTIATVNPGKSFNLVRVETAHKMPLHQILGSYKVVVKKKQTCSKDERLVASSY